MRDPAERPLFADLRAELGFLGGELREMATARWELARLELQADLQGMKRLAIAWFVAVILTLTALPLLAVGVAELLDGCCGISRAEWLLIAAGSLLALALVGGYLAWRCFRRRFVGLRETLEELREDMLWFRETDGRAPH